jgi:hypothetical protein
MWSKTLVTENSITKYPENGNPGRPQDEFHPSPCLQREAESFMKESEN